MTDALKINKVAQTIDAINGFTLAVGGKEVYHPDNKPSAADLNVVNKAGDTMAGNLTAPKVLVSAAQGTEANSLTRKDYVDGKFAAVTAPSAILPMVIDANKAISIKPAASNTAGSMSAADKNKLDGMQGFAVNGKSEKLTGPINFDSIESSGFYNLYNAKATGSVNPPPFDYGTMIVIGSDKDGSTFVTQIATDKSNGATYIRVRNDSSFAWNTSGWVKQYSAVSKPTNDDLNLVDRAGDVMTGALEMKVPDTMGHGKYAIKLNNGSIGGINQLVFNDPSDTMTEGILFPKTGKNDQATTSADYDNLWAFDGALKFNGQQAYGEWNKPDANDVQALPDIRTNLSVDLNTIGTVGVYYQVANASAKTALHYPLESAGTLLVTRSAYGVQQEYTTFGGRKYQRGLSGAWNSKDGPWGTWTEFYSEAGPSKFVDKTGDTMTGNLTFGTDSLLQWVRNTDYAKIGFKNDSNGDTDSYMHFTVGDDDNEYFKFRTQASGKAAVDLLDLNKGKADFHVPISAHDVKNSITLNNKASISFQDGSNTRFHLLTDGNAFKLNHGNDAQTTILSVLPDGACNSIGTFTAKDFIQSTPQLNNAAASTRKDYVDAQITAIDAKNVTKAGDTMTGNLNVKTEIFVKDNVNVTGQLINFSDKAAGKVANETGITTARMVEMLTAMGAFKTVYWCGKVNWDYAGNNVLTDTGYGNIHLAGCIVEVIGTAQYMIRITTPTMSGAVLPNAQDNVSHEFIYVNHGASYQPSWRRQLNTNDVADLSGDNKGDRKGTIPYIRTDGVMEISSFIDMHHKDSAADFDLRLQLGSAKQLQLVSTNGTIEIGAQNTSHAHIYTDRPSFYFNKGLGTVGNININSASPSVVLQDTDGMGAWIHNNSNICYILRTPSANNGTFDAGPNGIHPMTLNLENGDVQFSRNGSFNNVQIRSDIRLKSNLVPIVSALDKVNTLKGFTFDKVGCDNREAGIIAQDLQKVLPEAVGSFKNTAGDEFLTIESAGVNALLIEAIKELSEKFKQLEARGK